MFLDLAHHGQQILFVAAVELGHHVGIRVAMEHSLLHVQLVGIGVEQAGEDRGHIRRPAGVVHRPGSARASSAPASIIRARAWAIVSGAMPRQASR